MKTILVSGASGVVGYGILRSLLHYSRDNYRLIGTTNKNLSVAPAFCDICEIAPLTTDPNYIDWLCEMIKKYHIDMIIPGIEIDVYTWNQYREKILSCGAFPLLNTNFAIQLCQDKWIFYEKLKSSINPYLIPTSIEVESPPFDFPYILKPRRGFGSKGIYKIWGESDLKDMPIILNDQYLVQPLIGQDDYEFTVSGFFSKESNLLTYIGLQRVLAAEGYTDIATYVDHIDFFNVISEIGAAIQAVGPTNFQFRTDESGELKLLEVNPRISSSTSIRALLGYNESVMSAQYFIEGIEPQRSIDVNFKNKTIVRYVDERVLP